MWMALEEVDAEDDVAAREAYEKELAEQQKGGMRPRPAHMVLR